MQQNVLRGWEVLWKFWTKRTYHFIRIGTQSERYPTQHNKRNPLADNKVLRAIHQPGFGWISEFILNKYLLKVAERNRGIYRRLKAEVESLREGGIYLSRKMQEEGANMMQRNSPNLALNSVLWYLIKMGGIISSEPSTEQYFDCTPGYLWRYSAINLMRLGIVSNSHLKCR